MSSRVLQSPINTGTRRIRAKALPVRWTSLDAGLGRKGFLRSWVQDDLDGETKEWLINRRAICGMAVAFAISAGFWAGVGMVISRFE